MKLLLHCPSRSFPWLAFAFLLLPLSHLVSPSLFCWSSSFPEIDPLLLLCHALKSRFHIWGKTYSICFLSIIFLFHWFLQIVTFYFYVVCMYVCVWGGVHIISRFCMNDICLSESGLFYLTQCSTVPSTFFQVTHLCLLCGVCVCVCYIFSHCSFGGHYGEFHILVDGNGSTSVNMNV